MGDPTDANSDGGVALIAVAAAIDITGIYCCDSKNGRWIEAISYSWLPRCFRGRGRRLVTSGSPPRAREEQRRRAAYFARLSLLVRFALTLVRRLRAGC